MRYIAAFDIGSTAVKGVLFSEDGRIVFDRSLPVRTESPRPGVVEQDADEWLAAVKSVCAGFSGAGIDAKEIAALVFSGQMEDVIAVDGRGAALRKAILYSDARAEEEAEFLARACASPSIPEITGNAFGPSKPAAKLLWLKNNEPAVFAKADFLFGAKDYILLALTGKRVIDYTTASTVGLLDIGARRWSEDILSAIGLTDNRLPELSEAAAQVGAVSADAARDFGLAPGTPVLNGMGDAAASTIGAGVVSPGAAYVYLGTTGWIAAARPELSSGTVFNLISADPKLYLAVAPFFNAGSVHKWATNALYPEVAARDRYDVAEGECAALNSFAEAPLFLPYLVGERFPVSDGKVRASYIGVEPGTTRASLYYAALEGVAFSVRTGMLALGADAQRITLLGGVGKSAVMCRILADVLETEIAVPTDPDFMPSLGVASAAFIALGWSRDYAAFAERFVAKRSSVLYAPSAGNRVLLRDRYDRYARVYDAVKGLFTN